MELQSIGRGIIGLGVVLVLIGVGLLLAPRIPWLGRLPGDIYFKKDNVSVYFPIVTCLIVSLIFTIIMNIFKK